MKKIFLLLIFILCISHVNATNKMDITKDTELKFKWYKEKIIDEFYYPKKDKLSDYLEDQNNIEYGEYSEWSTEYCDYSEENYHIERKTITTYDKLDKIKYIKINNASSTCPSVSCINEVKVYYNHENITYKVLYDNYFGLLLELPNEYEPEKLLFYINTEHQQVIYLSKIKDIPPIAISSPASAENIVFLNDLWNATDSSYINVETEENIPNIPLIKNIETKNVCRIKEIKTYRYKLVKEYYSEDYYSQDNDYIPDITDYIVNYTKEFPQTKEIIKEIVVPKVEKEYIYLQDESINDDKESKSNQNVIYKTEYIDKVINKVPIKIYIILVLLIIIITILLIKLLSKKVDWNFWHILSNLYKKRITYAKLK